MLDKLVFLSSALTFSTIFHNYPVCAQKIQLINDYTISLKFDYLYPYFIPKRV